MIQVMLSLFSASLYFLYGNVSAPRKTKYWNILCLDYFKHASDSMLPKTWVSQHSKANLLISLYKIVLSEETKMNSPQDRANFIFLYLLASCSRRFGVTARER